MIIWMIFQQPVASSLHEKYENIKKQFKSHNVTQYSGQDLSLLSEDFHNDAMVLKTTGCYDHSLTYDMIKTFLKAGGSGDLAEDFCHPLRSLKERVDQALIEI